MADPQHLSLLKRGVETWNTWRQRAGEPPDLSEAELDGADLGGIDLGGVHRLGGSPVATLDGVDLCQADLRLANLRGAELAGANLAGCDLAGADLSEADLYGADLQGADLSGTNFEAACLTEAQLFEADLTQANLASATLDDADLGAANLRLCDLEDADLRKANLRDADLRASRLVAAQLGGIELTGARLDEAQLRDTLLVDLDLSQVRGLSRVKHLGPSSIGTDTLARTAAGLRRDGERRHDVEAFYRGAGIEPHLLEHLHLRGGGAPDIKPCYIVHHRDDGGMASLLHDELQARGVSCWLAPGGHGTPSARAARARGIKVVLCVSGAALKSLSGHDPLAGVAATTRGRAQVALRETLIIVDLDGRLSDGWGGTEADHLRALVAADFSRLESEQTTLETEIGRVIDDLAG